MCSTYNTNLQCTAPRVQVSIVAEVQAAPVALAVNESDIAWKTDRSKKFGSYLAENFNVDPATRGGGTIEGRNAYKGTCVISRTSPDAAAVACPVAQKAWHAPY